MFFIVFMILPLKEEPIPKRDVSIFSLSVLRKNLRLYLSFFLRHTGAFAVWTIYPLFLAKLGANALWTGIIYSINPFLQFFFMLFVKRLNALFAVKTGLFLSFVTFILFFKAKSHFEIIPYQIVLALSWALLYLGSLYYLLERNIERSTVSGALNGVTGLCGTVGPFFGGTLGDISLRLPMIFGAGLSLAGFLMFFSKKK